MNPCPRVECVVEGDGELRALPVLVRRIAEACGHPYVQVGQPWRLPRPQMVTHKVGHAAQVLARRVGSGPGGVLVVLDADDDHCPVELASRVRQCCADTFVALEVTVAHREFESWFLAGVESLRGRRSLRTDAVCADDPEGLRDAKGRLGQLMDEKYRPPVHQPAFAAVLDLDAAAERSRSLRRLRSAVERLTWSGPE